MAHPIGNEHKGHRVEKERVKHLCRGGYASGGAVNETVARPSAGSIKATPALATGGAAKARADKTPRRARGGRTGKKASGKTNVNVIVAPSGAGAHPPLPMPPPAGAGAAPPPMPPKPPMAPPMGAAGPPPGLGGMPPMPPRAAGGRAYNKGGAVKDKMSGEKKHPKHAKPFKMRADGGVVGKASLADKRGVTGIGARTKIQHSGNKSDTQNIGRGPAITRKTGGPIFADGAAGKQMGPKLHGGSHSGIGRREKAHRENPAGHEEFEGDIA